MDIINIFHIEGTNDVADKGGIAIGAARGGLTGMGRGRALEIMGAMKTMEEGRRACNS